MSKQRLYRFAGFISCFIFSFASPVSAISTTFDEQFYSSNDILFYDPRALDCTTEQGSGDSVLFGGNNLENIFNYFVGKGLSPAQAAGIVGNISQESMGNPKNAQKGPDTDDPSKITGPVGGGNAWGIIQWDAGARAIEYAKKAGITTPIGDLSTQLNIVWWHMNNETPTGARNMLKNYKTITDVSAATRDYEKKMTGAGTPRLTNRLVAAQLALSEYGNGASGGATAPAGSAPVLSCDNQGAGLVSGGMNLQQGQNFMKEYKDLAVKYANKRIGDKFIIPEEKVAVYGARTCLGSALANCSSFTEFFVGKYTTGTQAFPDGKNMVGALLATNSGFKKGGSTPKTYAVFSRQSGGGGAGHTGIILGVDKSAGKMIVGEASCGAGIGGIRAYEVNIASFSTSDYSYAYTDDILKNAGGLTK